MYRILTRIKDGQIQILAKGLTLDQARVTIGTMEHKHMWVSGPAENLDRK